VKSLSLAIEAWQAMSKTPGEARAQGEVKLAVLLSAWEEKRVERKARPQGTPK